MADLRELALCRLVARFWLSPRILIGGVMHKNVITMGRLRTLRRVEQYIGDHPGCTAREIGAALSIKLTTLNAYTLDLRRMKRIVMTVPDQTGIFGSRPCTYERVPDLGPLLILGPVVLPRNASSALKPDSVRRDPFVVALFGPARSSRRPRRRRITS